MLLNTQISKNLILRRFHTINNSWRLKVCIFMFHEISFMKSSSSLHLFDQKYCKIVKYYYNLKHPFSIFIIFENIIYSCDAQLYFQHHYSSLQCHMIFRNHSNMLICCSRNISIIINVESSCAASYFCGLKVHLFEIQMFCNIINVFKVTFENFNVSLLNKSINFFKKILLITNFCHALIFLVLKSTATFRSDYINIITILEAWPALLRIQKAGAGKMLTYFERALKQRGIDLLLGAGLIGRES